MRKKSEKNYFLFRNICNLLIFKKIFSAFWMGILLKGASVLVWLPVKRIFSTEFSTDFVDSKKKACGA